MNALKETSEETSFFVTKEVYKKVKNSSASHYKEGITFYEKMWEIINQTKNEMERNNKQEIYFDTVLINNEVITVAAKWEEVSNNVYITLKYDEKPLM